MKSVFIFFIIIGIICGGKLRAQNRWKIEKDGGILWEIKDRLPHDDHIEMSGEQLSVVLRYGVNAEKKFCLERSVVWPMLRTIPNNTHASLMHRFAGDILSWVTVNGLALQHEQVKSVYLKGLMQVKSDFSTGYVNIGAARKRAQKPVVEVIRTFYPSMDLPVWCERYEINNISDRLLEVFVPEITICSHTDSAKGVEGEYVFSTSTQGSGTYKIAPGRSVCFYAGIQAYRFSEKAVQPDYAAELYKREKFVEEMGAHLCLETPDPIVNTMFKFAKIRAAESIYKTRGGYMHGPGGESYYAAIWANDQAEYVNPFFPYLGYEVGNLSALNAFRHFARFMNADYKPIPSSIIAEGKDIWNGAGDRGDAAMIAYGAARYALARGSKSEAKELWPLIEWCLEYCKRKRNTAGVVESDTDELEGRFPAGDANLCTSSLYYDALCSAVFLGKELGISSRQLALYRKEAQALQQAIEEYFGARMGEFDTYRYYRGNDLLRSWICIPLTMGITDRAEGTLEALFSPRLWTENGLLTQEGSTTFWDRSTLYALRGAYAAGATEKATAYLQYYSRQRLVGEHVPYAIEAWPEGSQRHLSAESGLYSRVITEGLFGIRPTGLASFVFTPRLPADWEKMALRNIRAFGRTFDIEVIRKQAKLRVVVKEKDKIIFSKTTPADSPLSVKFSPQ